MKIHNLDHELKFSESEIKKNYRTKFEQNNDEPLNLNIEINKFSTDKIIKFQTITTSMEEQ